MTEQTLKDIDRAFKALEERDELLDKIKADVINIADGKQSIKVRSVFRIIDKYKAEEKGGNMIKEDIDRIASEYFDDKESEHEMDEVFDLAKKALEERKEDILNKISHEIEASKWTDRHIWIERNALADGLDKALEIIDKYREEQE